MTPLAREAAPHDAAGRWAEARARAALEEMGLSTLAANVRFRAGELDLVMTDGETVVFVEVRHRTHARFGGAATSLDARKAARVRTAAALWLATQGRSDAPVRFDAVLLDGPPASARLTHVPDAF